MNVILLAQMVYYCIPISAIDWISLKSKLHQAQLLLCVLYMTPVAFFIAPEINIKIGFD